MSTASKNLLFQSIFESRCFGFSRVRGIGYLTVFLGLVLGLHVGTYAQEYLKSRGGLLPVEQNEKWGYIDLKGKLVIPFKFDDARRFTEGLAPVMVDKQVLSTDAQIFVGKWGYIDQKGNFIVQPAFDFCDTFSEGLAEVRLNGKNGYVDRTGKIAIEPQFFHTAPFQEGLALIVRDKDRQKEFIDRSGNTEFKVDETEGMGVSVGNFYDGHATVFYWDPRDRQRDKYGYFDISGKVTFLPYRTTEDFREGLAAVFNEGKNGFIGTNYDLAISVKFEDAKEFSEGFAPVQVGEKYGYIDRTGNLVIPPKFDDAEPFNEGLAAVANEDGKWGFINKKGKLVIGYKFEDEVGPFIEGIAEVRVGDEISYLLGYINTKGQFIWKGKKLAKE